MSLDLSLLSGLAIAILVWLTIITILLVQMMLHYRRLTKNISKKDLKSALTGLLNQSDAQGQKLAQLEKLMTELKTKTKSHIQKVGFVRFNPFPATGGDQSFTLSLLDETNSGFVLSSLHSRDNTRFYAKTVTNGQGDGYELSKEEIKAITNAK